MKFFSVFALLLLSFNCSFARYVPGFIIRLEGDTVAVNVRIPGAFANFSYTSVEVTDSSNAVLKFTPADIRGYGFTDKGVNYVYLSKKIRKGELYFLEQVAAGPKAGLYQYILGGGGYGSPEVRYTVEKADGSLLFIKNYAALDEFRSELGAFFKEYPVIQQLIGEKFSRRGRIQEDIREVVDAVSRQ